MLATIDCVDNFLIDMGRRRPGQPYDNFERPLVLSAQQ